jgi:hypothetical protein
VPMLSFAFLVSYICMYGLKRVGSTIVRDGRGAVIMLMGQSSFSLGLEWTGFHTRVIKVAI